MANRYDEVSIYKLPPEIFHTIFSFLASEDLYKVESGSVGRKKPISSFAISQVSQRWRMIALEFPPIWTDIRIFHFHYSQRFVVKELVSRAQGLPLHFLLEYDRPLTPMETRNFWEIFLIIMSNSSSWHFLRIEVVKDLFVEICGHFSGGREAPLLRQLELVVLQSSTLDRHHPDAHDPPPIYLELRRTPLLRHLVLHGIHLRMPSPIFMEQLEILDIDSSPAMEMLSRPPLPNHSPPLSTSLRSLSLAGIGILDLAPRSFLSEYTAFLTSLSLSNMHGQSIVQISHLFAHLPSSTLRELSLSNADLSFWNGLLVSMGIVPRFPSVRKLVLADVSAMTEMPDHFIWGFPSLEILALYNMPSLVTNKFASEPLFPKLRTLLAKGVPYKVLCNIVDFRIEANVMLTGLVVDSPDFIDWTSLAYLQSKVRNFRRVAPGM